MKRKSHDFSFEKISKGRSRSFQETDADEIPHRHAKARDYRRAASDAFRCKKCKTMIDRPASGTLQRNHCPVCLYSVHVDTRAGDRAAECGSSMEPISIWVRSDEWVLLHRCLGCGVIHSNRIAPDDNEAVLLSLAARPLGRPAFPLYTIGEEESD